MNIARAALTLTAISAFAGHVEEADRCWVLCRTSIMCLMKLRICTVE